MKIRYCVGADISKATVDFSLLQEGQLLLQQQVENTQPAIKTWIATIKMQYRFGGKNTLFCLEHTGPYSIPLIQVVSKTTACLWVETPLQIKHSLGIQRGKNDRLDSLRIAQYAYLKREAYVPWKGEREVVGHLKQLSALRRRIQWALANLQLSVGEQKTFMKKAFAAEIASLSEASVTALRVDLKAIEKTMLKEVKGDERLDRLYEILTSVPSVGPVLAMELLIVTNEFKKFATANQFASYAGVAPFGYSSGTSVKKKDRVSKIASRKVKALFFMPALSALRNEGELRTYYLRKVAEGHASMSVLNAVKNKLIHRIFACVMEDRLYQKDKLEYQNHGANRGANKKST